MYYSRIFSHNGSWNNTKEEHQVNRDTILQNHPLATWQIPMPMSRANSPKIVPILVPQASLLTICCRSLNNFLRLLTWLPIGSFGIKTNRENFVVVAFAQHGRTVKTVWTIVGINGDVLLGPKSNYTGANQFLPPCFRSLRDFLRFAYNYVNDLRTYPRGFGNVKIYIGQERWV